MCQAVVWEPFRDPLIIFLLTLAASFVTSMQGTILQVVRSHFRRGLVPREGVTSRELGHLNSC